MGDGPREQGHVRVANRLYEAIVFANFNVTQTKILLAIVRLTYGWRKADVAISTRELAARVNLKASSGFYRSWSELVAEGVVRVIDGGGGAVAHRIAIEPDFQQWGKYAVWERHLATAWDGSDRKLALPPDAEPLPNGGEPTAADEGTLSPTGEIGSPQSGRVALPTRGEVRGRKSTTPSHLAAPTDRTDRTDNSTSPRTARGEKAAAPRVTWITPFADAWRDRFGGKMPVEPALKPLREAIEAHGETEVLRRWRIYLDQASGSYQPTALKFTSTWDEWAGGAPGRKASTNGAPPLAQLVAALAVDYSLTSYDPSEYKEREARALADPRVTDPTAVKAAIRAASVWNLSDAGSFLLHRITERLSATTPARAS